MRLLACVKKANCPHRTKMKTTHICFTLSGFVGSLSPFQLIKTASLWFFTPVWHPMVDNWPARWSSWIAISSTGTQLPQWLSPRDWCGWAPACPVKSIKCHLCAMSAWWITPQDLNYRDGMMNTTLTMDKIIGIRQECNTDLWLSEKIMT